MLILTYCYNAPDGFERRAAALAPHADHARVLGDSLRLAAPLKIASADTKNPGSLGYKAAAEDAGIVGALYAVEMPDLEAAVDAMRADPFFTANVWQRLEFYESSGQFGIWTSNNEARLEKVQRDFGPVAMLPPLDGGAIAVIVCRALSADAPPEQVRADHARYYLAHGRRLLIAGGIAYQKSVGANGHAVPAHALYMLRAEDAPHALAIAQGDPCVAKGFWAASVFTVPIAVGSWIGKTVADVTE